MTLAARCPACGTVFRVVQDQLRVSDGWVRCGRCTEVFNAIDTLLEIDTDLPPKAPARTAAADRVLSELARVRADPVDIAPRPAPAVAVAAPAVMPPAQAASSGTAPLTSIEQAAAAMAVPVQAPPAPEETTAPADRGDPSNGANLPAFVRQAERAALWRRPAVRMTLAVAALLGAGLLAAQTAVAYRDTMAARWPSTHPLLESLCGLAGCRIEAPRAIDALAVDSSGLVRIEGTSSYRLNVVLRNRSAWALAVPSIDLTLTDSQGQVIARRVLGLSDFGVQLQQLAPERNVSLQAALSGPDRPVSGYTIEIFYP